MGKYLNPGNASFTEAVNSLIYIDKTDLIGYTNLSLNTYSKFICVSRPRRFGKTMAADMLVAYYSRGCDSRSLFAGRKAQKDTSFETHLNQHNVIRIDVQPFLKFEKNRDTFIDRIQEAVLRELRKAYPDCVEIVREEDLQMALDEIYLLTGEGFIFIIDEWDCIFRVAKERKDLQKAYLDFLCGLFKGAVYVDLVYMTGILPIKKYGEHSAVNMFTEFSVTEPKILSRFFGYTTQEVKKLCEERQADFCEMEQWYDGYIVGDTHIYNPKSVNDAATWKEYRSYWVGTETYDALKVYIERNFDGLQDAVVRMLGGGRCKINTRRFQNDMTTFKSKDDVLTLLVHLGYLTYDAQTEEVFIPNREIAQEFKNALDGDQWGGLMRSLDRSAQLLRDTWGLDGDAVAAALDEIHAETTSQLKFHDENSLACVIYIAYYSASAYYTNPIAELPTGKGRADIVYLPQKNVDKPALLVELKWDKSAESAIRQIKEKRYAQWLENYTGEILLVGINYDTKTKRHRCVIEKHQTEAGCLAEH